MDFFKKLIKKQGTILNKTDLLIFVPGIWPTWDLAIVKNKSTPGF